MTPEQVALVRDSVRTFSPRMDAIADDFYQRIFAMDPDLRAMFGDDMVLQRQKFADELEAILAAIPDIGTFIEKARMLGARHSSYGVRSFHYREFRDALLAAFAAELGDGWTDELATAWRSAYDMVAEAMMMGTPRARPTMANHPR